MFEGVLLSENKIKEKHIFCYNISFKGLGCSGMFLKRAGLMKVRAPILFELEQFLRSFFYDNQLPNWWQKLFNTEY